MDIQDRTVEFIESWRQSVRTKRFDFEGNPSMVMHEGRSYGRLEDLLLVQMAADYSANFYFHPDGRCALVYITDLEVLVQLHTETILEHYGVPDVVVDSRAGDRYRHLVYAAKGFACSAREDEVRFVEVFPECGVGEYLAGVYGGQIG